MESSVQGTSGVQPTLSHQDPCPASQELLVGQNSAMIPSGVQEGQTGMDLTAGKSQAETEEQQPILNTALMCEMGQETVKEILSKSKELFSLLKSTQLPNDTVQSLNTQEENKLKVQEYMKAVNLGFKKLRMICDKCDDNTAAMEYTHAGVADLVPLKDENDPRKEGKNPADVLKSRSVEHQELLELNMMRDMQLKELIDQLRSFMLDSDTIFSLKNP